MTEWKIRSFVFAGLAGLAVLLVACSADEPLTSDASPVAPSTTPGEVATSTSTPTSLVDLPDAGQGRGTIVFSPEGNNLWAYDSAGESQLVNINQASDPNGWDINGQVCTLEDGRIITGEDTHQPDPPAGWGIFAVTGTQVGDLAIDRTARLVPTYPDGDEAPDNFGCGVLSDGRVVTTTIGNSAEGEGNGQLLLWFPPFESTEPGETDFCVVNDEIATAQQIWVDDDSVLVAAARPPSSGIWRWEIPAWSTASECERIAGAQFITPSAENQLISPNGIVGGVDVAGDRVIYVSSIINGVIAEFDGGGAFRRMVLVPPVGETLGATPYSTGTPLGLAVDAQGSLWYADLGLVRPGTGLPEPGPGTGSLRRIDFSDGEPLPPVLVHDELSFPDALGMWP